MSNKQQNTREAELKPCTLCGSSLIGADNCGTLNRIFCYDCGLSLDSAFDQDGITRWNRRDGAASRWVPVSERMPPNSDRVDVSVCSADGDNFVESDVGWNGREWWNADYDGPVEDGGDVVTAWRPRPEPFIGE